MPTCHSDLCRGTGFAGKNLELFCLVHGVVSAGDNQGVSRPPGLHIVHQVQDGAVYVGVNADRELGPHCNPKQEGVRCSPLPSANMWLAHLFPSPLEIGKCQVSPSKTQITRLSPSQSQYLQVFEVNKNPTKKDPFISSGQRNFPLTSKLVFNALPRHTHFAQDVKQI